MSSKKSNGCQKQCDRYKKHASTYLTTKSDKSIYRVIPSASVTSKNISSKDSKTLAPDSPYLYKKTPLVKPKKTTRSEFCFTRKVVLKNSLDYCAECGDVVGPVPNYGSVDCRGNHNGQPQAKPAEKTTLTSMPVELDTVKIIKENNRLRPNDSHGRIKINIGSHRHVPGLIKEKGLTNKQPVQQYYKNENFKQKSDSAYEINNIPKKIPLLDTIKEVPEKVTEETSSDDNVFRIYKEPSEEYIPVEGKDNVRNLKDFRNNNYFETHSVESRIESGLSATNLGNHKCSFRFYLNDRLFPVPLYADRHETIRCIECQLPLKMDEKLKDKSEDINGIIQTKVKIGSGEDVQDMLLLLPVKEPLIIKEKRLAKPVVKDEIVYFGVIKLSRSGDSLFCRNGPSDSYALKYQKGYTEYTSNYDDRYDRVGEGDVIII